MTGQPTPAEGACARCQQARPVFPYKPEHDCIADAGNVDLIEAANWIAGMEEQGDRWCLARIERQKPGRFCVPCHDKESADERDLIKEYDL